MKKGSHHSPEALKRMRKGCKARYAEMSPEDRKRLVAHLHRPHDAATIQKQSEAAASYWRRLRLDKEQLEQRLKPHRKAMAKRKTKKKMSEGRKAYFAAHPEALQASIDRITTPVTRKKVGQASKKWWADPRNQEKHDAIRRATATPKACRRRSKSMKRVMANNPALAQAVGDRSKAAWALQRAAKQPKRGRGRGKDAKEDRSYFRVGLQVEKEIPTDRKQDRYSIVAARRLVTDRGPLEYDAVAEYHRRYRQEIEAQTPTEIR